MYSFVVTNELLMYLPVTLLGKTIKTKINPENKGTRLGKKEMVMERDT